MCCVCMGVEVQPQLMYGAARAQGTVASFPLLTAAFWTCRGVTRPCSHLPPSRARVS